MDKKERNRLTAKGLTAGIFMIIGFVAGLLTQIK